AGSSYNKVGGLILPNITTGSGTITIETDHLANLPAANNRVDPSYAQYMPKIIAHGGNNPAIGTATGPTGPHNYTLLGLEVLPESTTASLNNLIELGGGSNQTTTASVPH